MKKKLCSWLLVLTMVLGLFPAVAFAQTPISESATATVTVTMDTRVVAEDVTDYGMTALPASVQVTVDDGATVAQVMQEWAAEQAIDLTIDNTYGPYITKIGQFGAYGTQTFTDMCAAAGIDPIPYIFEYAGWTYTLSGSDGTGAGNDTVSDGDVVAFRYGLYMTSGTWEQVDHAFLDACDAVADGITAASAADQSDYSDTQWATLQTALTDAQTVKTAIDGEASGLWMSYFADKQSALWGTNSPTDQLEKAAKALQFAIDKVVAPTGVTFTENGVEIPLNRTYTIPFAVTPEGAPQDVTYEAFLGDTAFTVSDAGLITPSAKNSMCWVKVACKDAPDKFSYFRFEIVDAVPDEPTKDTISIDALLSNIAAGYVENSGEWPVMDMAAYEDANPDSAYKTTENTKQAYIDSAIAAVTAEGAGEAAYAKAILILQSIGADPQTLYPADSDTSISAVAALKSMDTYSSSAWVAPYTLIALNQGDYDTDELEQSIITSVLTNQAEDGSWSEWGDSIQTTANMIAGLSFYYDSDETVKTAVDIAVTFLSSAQKEDGTFDAYGSGSDANTAAMVVMALSALGIDPDTDERFIKNETSALDGLLSFALTDNSAFGYTDNITANSYATEQGFRALIAADTLRNVYDFSTNEVSPAYVGGAPSDDGDDNTPGGNTPVPDTDITASLTVKTHQSTWISNMRVEMEEDSTVADLIYEAAVQDENFSFTDSNGYISSMTYDGETWAEFDAGRNSGWKYTVNGLAPVVGMNDRVLEDGDKVVWYYVTDYTTDDTDDEEPVKPEKPVVEVVEEVELPFTDIENHWAQEAIAYCYSNGLMAGINETTFAPDLTTSRGMIVTILYALEEKPSVSGDMVFVDVDESAWYADAAAWAYKIGIVSGYGDGCFGPDDEITREQMALILMNYARYKGYSTKKANDLDKFSDAGEINAWALDALRWANAEGMMSGRGEDTIAPLGTATRAEAATILMRFLENHAE